MTVKIASFALLFAPLAAAQDPSATARLARFNEWKFGMFIHWGPYSQASVEASWPIMTPHTYPGITEERYFLMALTFWMLGICILVSLVTLLILRKPPVGMTAAADAH